MIKLNIRSPFAGAGIFFKPETGSTMMDARNLAAQGFPSGTVAAAGHQVAGRGRFPDRTWESNPGENLMFTIFFRLEELPERVDPVPLKAGLAVARALEGFFGLEPKIKWPNDVLLDGRKVAGVLAEKRGEHLFLGIGVNCLQKSFSKDLKRKAVALREVVKRKFTPEDLLPPLLAELRIFYDIDGDWKDQVESRLFLKGETVSFAPGLPGSETVSGRLAGVLDDGSLVIHPDGAAEPLVFAGGEILYEPPRRGGLSALFSRGADKL